MKLLALLVACSLLPISANAARLECQPVLQQECTSADGCRATDDTGYRQAERYTLDTTRQRLEACLFTQCYSGRTTAQRAADGSHNYTARLVPTHPGSAHTPLFVIFTLDARSQDFNAVRDPDGAGMIVSFGACEAKK